MTTLQLTDNIKSYIVLQLDKMSVSNPVICFMKPFITRILDKNYTKVKKALDLIADNDGNIDIENILTEMIQNVMNTKTFILPTSFIGDIQIGEGNIIFNIPFIDKRLMLDINDLETFKEMITNKN